jgi:N-sulfoglucosamine sulfohydrolase
MKRRDFVRACGGGAAALAATRPMRAAEKGDPRPNILFAFADDWIWPHAGVAGDPVIKTPTFDRVAREGVLFTRAYVSAPSCTPSRGAILTGQYHWRLQEGANLWSTLPAGFDVYPDLLERAGYHVGFCRKGWGPGSETAGGRKRNPAGPRFKNLEAFLAARPAGKPFCFWFGSHDPHRGYKWQSGKQSGMKLQDVRVPACLPDHEIVRTDLCDYYWEVQRYDRETGEMLKRLEAMGELDNTIVVMSGDNGLPFPRCKSNLYDLGTNAPLGIRWPAKAKGGRVVDDFVSLCDLAPTFLEAAGLKPVPAMTGRSLMTVLTSGKSGRVDAKRDHVLVGMERHTCAQTGSTEGYPMRAIHTHDYLYIRNFKPDRWPAGTPEAYRDIDGSPTKTYMMKNRDDAKVRPLFKLAFGKRPAEELYDRRKDPGQLHNVAADPAYAEVRKHLAGALMAELKATADPRVLGSGDVFDRYPYRGGRPKRPQPKPAPPGERKTR